MAYNESQTLNFWSTRYFDSKVELVTLPPHFREHQQRDNQHDVCEWNERIV
jgi:hypothetical protein